MIKDVICDLETGLMPQFKEVAAKLSLAFPDIAITTGSAFAGGADAPVCWTIYISCIFKKAQAHHLDLIDLCVDVGNLRSTPTINGDICWGHPSGSIEMSVFESVGQDYSSPIANSENIQKVRDALPKLYERLEVILRAGLKPE